MDDVGISMADGFLIMTKWFMKINYSYFVGHRDSSRARTNPILNRFSSKDSKHININVLRSWNFKQFSFYGSTKVYKCIMHLHKLDAGCVENSTATLSSSSFTVVRGERTNKKGNLLWYLNSKFSYSSWEHQQFFP